MKKGLIYLLPVMCLLAGCGKNTSISINTDKVEGAVGITEENSQVDDKDTQNIVQMIKAHVFYKTTDGQNKIPQIELEGNEQLRNIIEEINTYRVNEYASMDLTRADTNVLSLFIDSVVFDEGELISGINIDSNTGKELKISDVLENGNGLYEKLVNDNDFLEEYEDDIDDFSEKLKTDLTNFEAFDNDVNKDYNIAWTLGNNGMQIYMIGKNDGIDNMVVIPLEYAIYSEYFKNDILKLPSDYAFEVLPDRETRVNIDGKVRTVEVGEEIGEYGISEKIEVKIGGEQRTYQDGVSYGISKAYILQKDNNAYLYLELQYDNDYRNISIIDLNKNGDMIAIQESFANTSLLDPNEFYLGDRIFTISSLGVDRKYTLGEDGKPKTIEDYYNITTPITLSTKIELNGKVLDGLNGKEIGDFELPVGILLIPVGTDNKTFTDYKLSDESIVRIPMEQSSEYGFIIEGKNVEDVFDGTFFAG